MLPLLFLSTKKLCFKVWMGHDSLGRTFKTHSLRALQENNVPFLNSAFEDQTKEPADLKT